MSEARRVKDPIEEYVRLALHSLQVDDDAEYDRICDQLDELWVSMTIDERGLASVELARRGRPRA